MKRRLLAPALLLGAIVTLSACGSAGGTSAADAGADPTAPASADAATTSTGPAWPADCTDRAMSSIDSGRAPQGWKTPEEAIAHAADSTIPDGTVVVAPADAGSDAVGTMTVWVVDDATSTILASVHLTSAPAGAGGGLYVDGVETCA